MSMPQSTEKQQKPMDQLTSERRRQLAFEAFMAEVDALEPVTPLVPSVEAVRKLRGGG